MDEFELIETCFRGAGPSDSGLLLGNGDDCLIWRDPVPLAMSIDTAVAGRHFPADASPERIAQRALLPALSDLAAMGAEPAFFTLALTLPQPLDEPWVRRFAVRLAELGQEHGLVLAGGDTTAGPALVISIQVHGRAEEALHRAGARPDEDVWVSGWPGRAAAALPAILDGREAELPADWLAAYWEPRPRLDLGQALRGLASAAIDVSDGLAADLGHLARASGLGIELAVEDLPLAELTPRLGDAAIDTLLSGGDDYELAFTAATGWRRELASLARRLELPLTRIGHTRVGDAGVRIRHNGQPWRPRPGYQHFSREPDPQ